MKTVNIDGVRMDVEYKTSTDMRTKAIYRGKTLMLSCDIYNVQDGKHVALILNTQNGDIKNSTTILTNEEYSKIAELYDPYAEGRYHTACLEACGAENLLKLR